MMRLNPSIRPVSSVLSRTAAALLLLAALAGLSACAFLPVFAPMAVAGATTGINYTLTNIAYRTYTMPMDRAEKAVRTVLNRMNIIIDEIESEEVDVKIKAHAEDRKFSINLEHVTAKTTRISVDAKKPPFFFLLRDKATATEILNQVSSVLGSG